MTHASLILLAGATLLALRSVPAAGQQYFGEDVANKEQLTSFPNAVDAYDQFRAAIQGEIATEDFESFDPATTPPVQLDLPMAGTTVLSGDGRVNSQAYNYAGAQRNHRYATSGTNFFDVNAGAFSILFLNPVSALGFFAVDAGDGGAQLFLTFLRESGNTTVMVPHSLSDVGENSGSAFFYGFLDNSAPFLGVQFSLVGGKPNDYFAFDDLTVSAYTDPATVTPEPVSMALLGTGLAGIAAARRRRRKEQADAQA